MKAMRHAGIVVSDLEKAVYFYGELLGLKIAKRSDESSGYIDKVCGLRDSRLTTVKMATDNGNLIELLYFHSHPNRGVEKKLHDIGLSHIAFTVDDIEKEYKRLLGEGVDFVSSPKLSPDGYAKIAFCMDPDGVFIELVEVTEGR